MALVVSAAVTALVAAVTPALAANPITISNGLFNNSAALAWSSAPSTTMGDRTVTRSASGLVASGLTGSVFHQTLGVSRYMFIGTHNYVLFLETPTGGGTRSVSLVDFTTTPPTERPILSVLVTSAAVSSPGVQFSVGTGDAFFVFAPTGTTVAGLGIYRSDNGTILCPGPPPLTPTGQLFGEATATQLRIKMGGTVLAACTRPPGTSG
ncbi:hypothetical protein [Amycolatopsis vancoresmycina]|uniref:Uncharacterized protein n=1 Tax=Amycolatopsis vancoresmycina DSM 44592 TaxID=1292037 RepID=R1FW27_9PSEU|nr:hypothetical protein [Amycolatopsis vancoresmycina]EOD63598.1 hypothetical protein H480_36183 [Amycolatopsis vancoresmycina DSM 44592]